MVERVAILIGNSEFEPSSGLEPLKFPESDVRDLAQVLRDQAVGRYDEVIQIINQSSFQIKLAIEKALRQYLGAYVLIYYSGHGKVSDARRLYLAGRDTEDGSLVATAVRFDDTIDMKDNTGHSRVGIILDCCFAGLGQDFVKGSTEDQVKALVSGKGIFFMGASSSTQPVKEDETLGHGVLTDAILDGLKDGKAARANDGIVGVSDLFVHCRDFISSRSKQTPVLLNKTEGNEIIVAFSQPKISDDELDEIRSKIKWCREHKVLADSDLRQLETWFEQDPVPIAGKLTLEAGFVRYVRGELALPDLDLFREGIGDKGKSRASNGPDSILSVLQGPAQQSGSPTAGSGLPRRGSATIEQAWDEYRGWAKRARSLQANTDRWNFWAMVALVTTGVSGAASGFFAANPADWLPGWLSHDQFVSALACEAAIAAALSLFVGREAFAVRGDSGWLRARATAEAIKSECYRFAAGVADYAPEKASDAEATNAFIDRRVATAARAAGESLTPENDPVDAGGDDRRPSRPMTDKWYLANRIDAQIKFYRDGQEKNESAYQRLQLWSFVAGAVVAVVSAVSAVYGARSLLGSGR